MTRNVHGHRLRKGRVSETGRVYLITAVCHQRTPYFRTLRHGRCFVHALRALEPDATTLCYVIMPDHIHWMMQLGDTRSLAACVQKVKSLTTQNLRQNQGIAGPIWQRGYHDHALRREEDLQAVARYVIANPLRAGIVDSVARYSLWDANWL